MLNEVMQLPLQSVWLSDLQLASQVSSNVLVLPFSLQVPSLTEKVTKEMVWDPMVGFTIPYGAYDSYNMLTCHAKVNGQVFKSEYFIKRLSESVVFLVT